MNTVTLDGAQVRAAREAAIRIADALYAAEDEPAPFMDSRTFDLASFQEDAVRRARKILRARGGVLIADSVGLGKTYIALALIEQELGRGGRVLVATPAALRRMWRAPLRRIAETRGVAVIAGLGAGARSGEDDDAISRHTPVGDAGRRPAPAGAALLWISHTRLSRGLDGGLVLDGAAEEPTLVVVDEAHAFRNPRTRRYRELARISLNAHVVLLTATPVNNTLFDLYALIRLFAADAHFRDLGVEDLRSLFRAAALQPDAPPAPALLGVLRAIMIRRTRPLLREAQRRAPAGTPRLRFPERAPPRVLRYDLEATVPNLLAHVAECLDALTFAPFRVHAYGARRTSSRAPGAAELIRMMMLKRLESSVAALASSIDAQIAFIESFLEQLEGGRLFRPADHRATRSAGDADQLLLGSVALDPLPRGTDTRSLETDAATDLARLRTLRARLPNDAASRDAKLARLRELIDGELAGERVLAFTEFRETARYLWTALRDRGGIALIHGGGAFLGRSRCGRREVVERFAPAANGAGTPPPREAVHMLIATDVLSEGMNLQDARHIVSYDLPWNPVRWIQRIGRIDRLGSMHDVVFAHTFVPQRGLDRLIGLLERIRTKLSAIHTGVGAETAVPRELAPPAFVDRLARGDPRVLDEIERHDAAPFEAEERLRWAYRRLRSRVAGPANAAVDAATPVIALQRTANDPGNVLLAVRAGGAVRLALHTESGPMLVDSASAFEFLARLIEEGEEDSNTTTPSSRPPPNEPDRHAIARSLRVLSELLAERSRYASDVADVPRRHRPSPGQALTRRLLDALAREPGGPDAQLCARAEKVLGAVARGGPAGQEHALAAFRASAGTIESAADLCAGLESVLCRAGTGRDAARSSEEPALRGEVALIAAIELRGYTLSSTERHAPAYDAPKMLTWTSR